jgi:hypothetical protein
VRSGRSPGSVLSTLLSIVFAGVLWVVAINKRTFEVVETVPVVPPALSESLVILEPALAESVTITFSGTGASVLIDQLRGEPLAVDLGQAGDPQEGPYPVSVRRDLSPSDILWRGEPFASLSVSSFSPSTIILDVDRSETLSIPVKAIASGPVPARFFWTRIDRASVDVTGAASVVQALDSVRTLPVLPGQPVQTPGFEPIQSIQGYSPASIRAWLIRPVHIVSFDDV